MEEFRSMPKDVRHLSEGLLYLVNREERILPRSGNGRACLA